MIKVLIAEDNLMVADILEEFLTQKGYNVCEIAMSVEKSIALANIYKPDIAILDQRLARGGLGTDVATYLSVFPKIGILYISANTENVLEKATNGHGCLAKPYRLDDLLRSMEVVAEMAATGVASPPFPRGFKILPVA